MRFQSRPLQLVGLLAFVVGLVGYVVFGWRFDSSGSSIVTALGIAGALVAIALTVLRAR
ncbi:hypothetical protein [Haladaptatus salinisoli]|uniref:hypothetical protein n=1 Tax=Haladaptatus salinisoli TaxID=2884876 RepID=UPI001D0B5798|nr:hypothetical protein [Haladaptatus salinisoli]